MSNVPALIGDVHFQVGRTATFPATRKRIKNSLPYTYRCNIHIVKYIFIGIFNCMQGDGFSYETKNAKGESEWKLIKYLRSMENTLNVRALFFWKYPVFHR